MNLAAVSAQAVQALRTRAELARRLSAELKEPHASAALREIADALDAEADVMENNVIQMPPRDEG